MNNERFSDLSLRIYPFVSKELERLSILSQGKSVLPIGRTPWQIVRMITYSIEETLQRGDEFIPEYHVPWMTQVLLKKGTTEKDLRLDQESQVLYKVVADKHVPISGIGTLDTIFSAIPDHALFDWFVNNIDQVCGVIQDLLGSSVSDKKDILILSNHATWFNLPLIAHCLYRIFGIPKENIYTIVGPAITHGHFNLAGILRFSNVLKTSPDTPKAEIGYAGIQMIRERFLQKLQQICSGKNGDTGVRVFLISPSGTTDEYKDGRIWIQPPSRGTETLINLMLRRMKLYGYAIGINDRDMIPSGSSRPKLSGGSVFTGGTKVDHINWKDRLPKQILDQDGNPIGETKKNPSN